MCYDAYVGRQQLALLVAGKLHLACRCDDESAQCVDDVWALFALLVALYNIFALLYGRDGWGVCRRASDAQFFEFVYEACLGVSCGALRVALGRCNLAALQCVALLDYGQVVGEFVALLVLLVVGRLAVYLQETVKLDNLAVGYEAFVGGVDTDGHSSLLDLSLRHLACSRALPYQVVESALLGGTLYRSIAHVCRAYGLVSLLCTLRVGVVVAWRTILLAIQLDDFLFGCVDAQV